MLMNIILRPGGGDKSRALPRPKVDVKADGPNVIIIRLTFPDNENIQGLRAFTPTGPEANDQFSAINDILPPNTSVERIKANSEPLRLEPKTTPAAPTPGGFFAPAESNDLEYESYDNYDGDYEDYYEPLDRPERQPEPVANPTRPPRPFKFPGYPPQPPVLLGKNPNIPPPPFKRSPPPPPSPPAPPLIPPSLLKNGKKLPKLFIQSSVSHGNRDFNYNVAVDRQDWKPLPPSYGFAKV